MRCIDLGNNSRGLPARGRSLCPASASLTVLQRPTLPFVKLLENFTVPGSFSLSSNFSLTNTVQRYATEMPSASCFLRIRFASFSAPPLMDWKAFTVSATLSALYAGGSLLRRSIKFLRVDVFPVFRVCRHRGWSPLRLTNLL